MFRLLLFLVLVVLPAVLPAQESVVSKAARKNLEKVIEAANSLDHTRAMALADKLVQGYPEWSEAWKVYAGLCMEAGDSERCEKALWRLVSLDSTEYPEAYRYLADFSFRRGDYEIASGLFKKFEKLRIPAGSLSFKERLLQSSILFALSVESNPSPIVPVRLSGVINSVDDEYFPSLSVDGSLLVFTRQKRIQEPGSGSFNEDLYFSAGMDSAFSTAIPFPSPINSAGNEGTQSLRQDGRIMFLTACNRPDTKGGCDIYYCIKIGDNWSDPINAGYPVNSRYWESTPFLSSDGQKLFFASNRPGGIGGMDLWYSTLNPDKSWASPVNIGPPVNTPLDELAPFLDTEGSSLFFSSDGHPGLGGLDLFISSLMPNANWSLPRNMGRSINTSHDEFGLTINSTKKTGLFSSNRDAGSGRDIYQVDLKDFLPQASILTLKGKVLDRTTGLPVGAFIEVMPHGDSICSRVESDPVTGEFLLGIPGRSDYRLLTTSKGYLPYSVFLVPDTNRLSETVLHDIFLEPLQKGAAIVLQNIFFELNSARLLPESEPDLKELLLLFKQYPALVIELSGHTDNTGSQTFNLELSRKRAESVKSYLTERGINAEQIFTVGYGQSKPLATNTDEAGRQLNRRTEMKILRLN